MEGVPGCPKRGGSRVVRASENILPGETKIINKVHQRAGLHPDAGD